MCEYHGVYAGHSTVNYTSYGFYDDWKPILDANETVNFIVDTRDATYGIGCCMRGLNGYFYAPSTAVSMFGINHAAYFEAAYHSLGLNLQNFATQQSFPNDTMWFMESDLRGSANRYLNDNIDDDFKALVDKYFYAIDFLPPGQCQYHANKEWCFEFDTYPQFKHIYEYDMILGERIYSVGATGVGPPAENMIPPQAISWDAYQLQPGEL